MPGVFAAGDVRRGSVKRVASAAGAGAIAIQSVHEYFVKARLGLDGLREHRKTEEIGTRSLVA